MRAPFAQIKITIMEIVWNFKVISDIFNIGLDVICT
jgi:hypothetical protein